jgi:hypothetical protein
VQCAVLYIDFHFQELDAEENIESHRFHRVPDFACLGSLLGQVFSQDRKPAIESIDVAVGVLKLRFPVV